MADDRDVLAAVVLSAGLGTRLRPLTFERPKALCPVGTIALVDLAIDRVARVTTAIAVNVHDGRAAMERHLSQGAGQQRSIAIHTSIEEREPLGTAGALGRLRSWLDGRAVLVVNVDAWCRADLDAFAEGWDGERIRMLTQGEARFHTGSRVAGALMPWTDVECLRDEPSGLYEVSWRDAAASGRIETVAYGGPIVDCGSPAGYLAANLLASAGEAVVDPAARVEGEVDASVVWDGAVVRSGEQLSRAIRTTRGRTVLVR